MALPTDSDGSNNKPSTTIIAASQTEINALEADLAELSELADQNSSLLGGEDVAQLLQRLSNAENVADGVESKLDNMLKNLDSLLAALDGAGEQRPAETKDSQTAETSKKEAEGKAESTEP